METTAARVGRGEDAVRRHVQRAFRELMTDNRPHTEILTVPRLEIIKLDMLATPDQQISLTDPDSRSMATSGRGSGVVGYNVQVAVETKHHLIVTHEVTNEGSDLSHGQAGEGNAERGEARRRCRPRLLQRRRDPGVRGGWHHRHTAKADDLKL